MLLCCRLEVATCAEADTEHTVTIKFIHKAKNPRTFESKQLPDYDCRLLNIFVSNRVQYAFVYVAIITPSDR